MLYAISELPYVKSKPIKRIIITFLVLLFCLIAFYKFITYDRTYTWAKEYPSEIEQIADSISFRVCKTENININEVELPTEKKIKIQFQKFLNKLDLMNYETEYGERIILKSETGNSRIICKSRNLGDYLIGIQLEYKNIDEKELDGLKKVFENKFFNYKLIWTKL